MIGDRKQDLIGAKDAKIGFVGVLFGFGTREELKDAPILCDSVEELKKCCCHADCRWVDQVVSISVYPMEIDMKLKKLVFENL